MRSHVLFWGIVTGLVSLSGCSSISFYQQALAGQVQISAGQKPIDSILVRNEIAPQRARKLRLILELREFASSHLALPAGRNYRSYTDVGREHVVWSVFAAPRYSLEPKTWYYPVVGELDYRGFFKEELARECANRLRSQGFDVFVGGVDAYSTLGWLADPVLNTFIDYEDHELAELIFHELTHRRVYRSGETAFNEALATAVAQEGVIRWLQASGRKEALHNYRTRLHRIDEIYDEIAETRLALTVLYNQAYLTDADKSARKRTLLKDFQNRLKALFGHWSGPVPDSWTKELPNNARLNATATYYEHVPKFEHYLETKCNGDLERFLEEISEVDVEVFLNR